LKALEIEKKNFGEEHVQYAFTLGNISICLLKQGYYQDAKKDI
jgi:hypothetical protein